MNLLLDATEYRLELLASSALIAVLATFVALALAKRVQTARTWVRAAWLVGAALCLGTGVWAAQVVAVAAEPLRFTARYHAGAVVGVWLLAVAVSMAALGWAGAKVLAAGRVIVAACGLALGVVVVQALALQVLGPQPGIEWDPSRLALALLAAAAGGALALGLFFLVRIRVKSGTLVWQTASAMVLGLSVFLCQQLVMSSAALPPQTALVQGHVLAAASLAATVTLATLGLLAAMLLLSLVEARMRVSLRQAKDELHRQSLRDPLTGLPNRQVFEGTMAQAIGQADASKGRVALLCVGLDGFKSINETFGHDSGDRLLREVAQRLRPLAKPHMTARLGGDEFLMLLNADAGQDAAASVAKRLLDLIAQPMRQDGREVSITGSIGIAVYPEHGAMSTLIAHADTAMREAKVNGGASYCFFEARMVAGTRDQAELLRDLRRALAHGELEMVYQPKVHAPSGEITGAEALMRWRHPKRGIVSPEVFIPIAERYGLIGALGDWVIEEACRQARAWRDEGLRMRVAINLSVHQLRSPDLFRRIDTALKKHQINPKLLTCEITESLAMQDAEATVKIFKGLAAVGVHISIDDFGTGYSSLSYLRKLPAEELKIDRSFVQDLEVSADARAVVDAVVKLAKALGLKVVAEGVETEAQNQILRGLGCDELQGYLFAKPMSAKALAVWAMNDAGPRSLAFRASLFKPTVPHELH